MAMKIVAQANIKVSDLVNGYLNDTVTGAVEAYNGRLWVINSAESFCNAYDFEQRLKDCEKYSFLSVSDLREYVNEIQDMGRVAKSFIAILKDCGYYSNDKNNVIDEIEKNIDDGIAWCMK